MNAITNQLISSYLELQQFVNDTTLWGWLPLDIVAHFFGGALITIVLLKCKLSFKQTLVTLGLLALTKECWDIFFLGKLKLLESLKDIAVTCAYAGILVWIRAFKKKNPTKKSNRANRRT